MSEAAEAVVELNDSVVTSILRPPATATANERIRDFLKSHLSTDSNGDATTDEESQRETAGSPPPNCAICLGKVSSKCFTDSCMHQFCFSCLLEWSKVSDHHPFLSSELTNCCLASPSTHRLRRSARCASRHSSQSSTMCGRWTSTKSTRSSSGVTPTSGT